MPLKFIKRNVKFLKQVIQYNIIDPTKEFVVKNFLKYSYKIYISMNESTGIDAKNASSRV